MIYSVRLNSSLENPLKFVKREKGETIQQKVQKDFQYLRNFTFYVAWPGQCNFSLPSWKDEEAFLPEAVETHVSCWGKEGTLAMPPSPVGTTGGRTRVLPTCEACKDCVWTDSRVAAVMAMSLLGQQIKSSVSHRGKDSLVSVVLLCALKYKTLWGTRCVVFPSISRKAT